jgi:predicted component of type VI protein secretion system
MPKIEVIRKGITPAVRPVPTDTTLVVLPVTLDQMGKEVDNEDEEAARVDSVNDAFEKFKPSIHFETQAGPEATEFVADLEFRSLKDFSPENIQKRIPGQRNDIADLKNAIDLLYRMKDRWSLPSVKRAWSNPAQRKQILAALARLHAELEKIAQTGKGGE